MAMGGTAGSFRGPDEPAFQAISLTSIGQSLQPTDQLKDRSAHQGTPCDDSDISKYQTLEWFKYLRGCHLYTLNKLGKNYCC